MHVDQNYCFRCNKDLEGMTTRIPTNQGGSMADCLEPCLMDWQEKRLCRNCLYELESVWLKDTPDDGLPLLVNYDFLFKVNLNTYLNRLNPSTGGEILAVSTLEP